MVERAGEAAGLKFKAHPHMLRHACGFALANKGHDTAPCRPISAIEISSTRFATPSWRRIGSKTSGALDVLGSTPRSMLFALRPGGKNFILQLIFASASTTAGIISGRVGSLQWLDPAKVARCFQLP
jgi:hypothetical protein